jgi:hypothetical protein
LALLNHVNEFFLEKLDIFFTGTMGTSINGGEQLVRCPIRGREANRSSMVLVML